MLLYFANLAEKLGCNFYTKSCLIGKLYLFLQMERKIIAWKNHFKDFYDKLEDDGTKRKVLWSLDLLKTTDRLPAKFVKHLQDGLYELRVEWQSNIFRVFFCFDKGNVVVLFQGFQKKTQKTPQSEITKALKLKKEYEESKE